MTDRKIKYIERKILYRILDIQKWAYIRLYYKYCQEKETMNPERFIGCQPSRDRALSFYV